MRKTTTLNVHHSFLNISLPFLHDCDVKMPNFVFYGECKHSSDDEILFRFVNLNFKFREVRVHLAL